MPEPDSEIPSSQSLIWDLLKRFLPLFLIVGLLAGGLMIYQLRNYYSQEINQRLKERTVGLRDLIRSELKSIRSQGKLIAQNSVVLNSTVDPDERSDYLKPFFNTLDFRELESEVLSLHDFRGDPIASNTTKQTQSIPENVIRSVKRDGGYFELHDDLFHMILPVRVHGSIEGFFSIQGNEQSIDAFFESIFSTTPKNGFIGVKNKAGDYLWRNRDIKINNSPRYVKTVKMPIYANSSYIVHSESYSSLFGIMNMLTWQILFLLGLGFLFTFGGLLWLSLKIIGPITRLTRELDEKNNRFLLAKRAGNTGIWQYNLETEELVWDDDMVEIFGRLADDYDQFLESVHPEDRDEVNSEVQKTIKTERPFHQVYRIHSNGDGELKWIDAHAVIEKKDGEANKMIGSCQDITKRKKDEKFLQRLNTIASDIEQSYDEKIQNALELGSDYFDLPLGFVTHIDQETQEIEYVYGHHHEIKPGSSADLSRAYCKKTIKEQAPVFLESTQKVRKVLGPEPYETFGLSCYLGGKLYLRGEVYGTVCFAAESDRTGKVFTENDRAKLEIIIQWITSQMERKRSLEEINQARQEAEKANEAKSRFLARMSHEIRTPLNAIMGMADLLSETELNEEQRHYVDVFQNSSEILLNLINDILDLSKIEAGELELNTAYFDIETLVTDTSEFFAEKAHGKGLELNVFVDPDCPPAVKTDSNRFRQIMVNLIGNAIKFTDDGEVNVNLSVQDQSDGTVDLRLDVQDTGEGISETDQENIFEEFAQTDESSTREHSGTGLGLSICENLVSKMDGTIGVESELDEGSTFYVEVSLSHRSEGPRETKFPDLDHDRLADHSILVVDDNATNREILTKYLRSFDMNVDTCKTGEEALDTLAANPSYDLILMDNQMPGLNGYEVLDQLPGGYQQENVLMLTSNEMKRSRNKADEYDLAGYYVKPVSRSKLVRVVSDHLFGFSEKATDSAEEPVPSDTSADLLEGELLLVEDDDNNRILVSSYLKDHDIGIDDAVNGEQALDLMKENEYDLVLMDLDMPVMDGYEATSSYREWENENRKQKMSIVALSAHAMEASRDKAEESGCNGYLAKPIQKEKLLQTVRSYFEA